MPQSPQLHTEHAVERATRPEAAGVLQQFQRERHRMGPPEFGALQVQDRRMVDGWCDLPGSGAALNFESSLLGTVTCTDSRDKTLPFRRATDHILAIMQIHASCAARDGQGVLLLGPPGSGKSDLLLRLLDSGFVLVADDRVEIEDGIARPAPTLAGLLEVRGLGIMRLPHVAQAKVMLAVRLGSGPRLPEPMRHEEFDVPLVTIDPTAASAPARVGLALDCALGRVGQVAGAFA